MSVATLAGQATTAAIDHLLLLLLTQLSGHTSQQSGAMVGAAAHRLAQSRAMAPAGPLSLLNRQSRNQQYQWHLGREA